MALIPVLFSHPTLCEPDWWNVAEIPGERTQWPYLVPYSSCPNKAAMSLQFPECEFSCVSDKDCSLFQYCCSNGCGKYCVPLQVNSVDECGCSVTFINKENSPDIRYRILNLIWESLSDSFTPSLDPYLIVSYGSDYLQTYLGPVESLCSFKGAINDERREPNYNALKKPRRILFIISSESGVFEEMAQSPLSTVYSVVCAIVVGEVSVAESLVNQLSIIDKKQRCLWTVDSFKKIRDVVSSISSIVNDGSCVCSTSAIPHSPCKVTGESCTYDSECDQPTHICDTGICSLRNCKQPSNFNPEPPLYDSYYYYYHNYDYNYGNEYFPESPFGFYQDFDYYYYFTSIHSNTPISSSSSSSTVKKHKKRSKHHPRNNQDYGHASNKDDNRRNGNSKAKLQGGNSSRIYITPQISLGCCKGNSFQCSGGPAKCVSDDSVCDAIADCINGDDETSNACDKRICGDGWFKCKSGQCITKKKVCDGVPDCPDLSDETCVSQSDCPPTRQHLCSTGECISYSQICNSMQDCRSGEDEIHCRCKGHMCIAPAKCLDHLAICDGRQDCQNGSDEKCGGNNPCPFGRSFKCDDGKCISDTDVCDGFRHCTDGSDEDTTLCMSEPCLPCATGECIPEFKFCNRIDDCSDSSDEQYCIYECGDSMFHCNSGEWLCSFDVCNYREECADGSDEIYCVTRTCNDTYPLLCFSGECIDYDKVCDGKSDCQDGSDEKMCLSMACPADREYRCPSGQCIDSDLPECFTSKCNKFRCKSGKCVPRCDGFRDCEDGNDEEDCEGMPCPKSPAFRCQSGECISRDKRCDGSIDCVDASDETSCQDFKCNGDFSFKCDSGECAIGDACDGILDCRDGSDEMNCVNSFGCYEEELKCNSGHCLFMVYRCDGYKQCFDGSDEDNCQSFPCPAYRSFKCASGECRKASHRCDGFTTCADGSDEKDCQSYKCPSYRPITCPSGICITVYQLCNGIDDCKDGSDEKDCESNTCPANAFKCNRGNCIPLKYRCDNEGDCDEAEDELDCEDILKHCGLKFRCDADDICIPKTSKCDGFKDCSDGADELGCTNITLSD